TAGKLSGASGLTTGAITGVVDRLERAGYVMRSFDAADRRKTVIVVVPDRVAEIEQLFAELGQRTRALMARFRPEEQAAIAEFARNTGELIDDFIRTLNTTR